MTDLPDNTMGIICSCSPTGEMDVTTGHNFGSEFNETVTTEFENILEGLNFFMKYHTDLLHQIGEMQHLSATALEIEEAEMMVDFEADKVLTEKLKKGSNVVKFPKGKMH
jgi:hypothetical protein